MKICFVVDNISGIGGLQRVVINLLNNLAQVTNYEIFLICSYDKGTALNIAYPLHSKIRIVEDDRLTQRKYSYLPEKILRRIHRRILGGNKSQFVQNIYFPKKELRAYESFLTENAIDIVIGVAPRKAAFVSLLKIKSKKVGWLHNTFDRYFRIKDEYEYGLIDLYERCFKDLDKLIVLTDNDKKEFHRHFGVSTQRIYNPLSFEIEKKSKLNNNNVLFIGRLQYSTKGLDLLSEIIKRVTDFTQNVSFTIVGENASNGKEILVNSLNENQVEKFVHIENPTKNVIPYYQNSSITISTSRIEGFGLIVTESMEAGVPVISFKTEGPSEIIEDGINGYLIDKFDTDSFAKSIINLLANRDELVKMGNAAQIRAQDFSSELIIQEWKTLFENLVQIKN